MPSLVDIDPVVLVKKTNLCKFKLYNDGFGSVELIQFFEKISYLSVVIFTVHIIYKVTDIDMPGIAWV